MFEKNNPTIALNVFYIKEMEKCSAYISKISSNCEQQIILLMISNKEKEGWHYLAAKKTICIIERNNLKNNGDSYYLNCLPFFRTKISLSLMKKYVKIKIFAELYYHLKKIINFNKCMKSDKTSCIIYADLESLIKKIDGCANNPEKSSTTKIGEQIPCMGI